MSLCQQHIQILLKLMDPALNWAYLGSVHQLFPLSDPSWLDGRYIILRLPGVQLATGKPTTNHWWCWPSTMRETKHTNDRSEVTNGLRCSEGARTFSPSLLPRNLKAEEARVLARLVVLQVGLREAYSRPRGWGSVAILRDKVESCESTCIEGATGSRGRSSGSWAKQRVRNTVGEGIRRTRKRSDATQCESERRELKVILKIDKSELWGEMGELWPKRSPFF